LKTIHSINFHETLGKLRVIYTEGDLLFAVCDVNRILGFKDKGRTIHRYCANMQKLKFGKKKLNFMNAGDIEHLLFCMESEAARKLNDWICYTILPGFKDAFNNTDEEDLPVEDELCLIHRRDYDRLAFNFAFICQNHLKLIREIGNCPITDENEPLRRSADSILCACEYILEKYGMTDEDIRDFNTDKILGILGTDMISPEEGGYVPYDQVVEAFGQTAAEFLTDWKHTPE